MVPYGTDVTSLTPEIIYTGVSISPASGEAQDFTNPVTYVVTAADGSDAAWTVTVAEETFDIGQAIADSINAVLADDPSAGSTVTSPISLPLDINLSIPGMWADILAAVNTAASTWILTSPPV
jgi:hypothetical protein